MTTNRSLVTGAAGHLGYNLVQCLLGHGVQVVAGVRNMGKCDHLSRLDCQIVAADIMNPASLDAAMIGVDTVYAVGAAFVMWSKDPERDIFTVNREGARNVLEAAARAGVRKIVYVSSMTAIDSARRPATEESWNSSREVAYEWSKTESEQLALLLAKDFGLDISTILPGAIYGPGFHEPSNTTGMFVAILNGQMQQDPGMYFLAVDVRDLAEACYQAAERGRNGERYLVAVEKPVSTTGIIEQARVQFPGLNIAQPQTIDRESLLAFARSGFAQSVAEGTPVQLYPRHVEIYAGADHLRADTSKAQRELGVRYRPMADTIADSLAYAYRRFSPGAKSDQDTI